MCLKFVFWASDIIFIVPFLVANGMVGLKEVMDGVKATTGKRNYESKTFSIYNNNVSSLFLNAILVMAFIS